MSPKSDKMKAVFLAALDKTTAAERTAFLNEACADDAPLRRQVEALLRAHEQSDPLLDRPAAEQLDETAGDTTTPDDSLAFLDKSNRPGALGRLGHYDVLQVVGRGSMGVVLRSFDEKLQRIVAIKVLAPLLSASGPARQRFTREARAAAAVTHDNVIGIHAVEDTGPVPYLVMQFIDGPTLQEKIEKVGPLPLMHTLRIGLQICEGLAAAHRQGLVHRDIKPANILLENGIERVKLTDFGLARAGDDASLTQSGMLVGTPTYMSPEQAEGQPVDARSDLFSLGSVIYTMCAGRPPFRAPTALAVLKRVCEETPRPIREINPEVPPWLAELVARLHAKLPADRVATAREVADRLAKGLADLQHDGFHPTPTVVPSTPEAVKSPPASSRRWVLVAAAFLLLGGLGFTEATGVTNLRGTVVRLFSTEGTLVVEIDDPTIGVLIDGKDIVITEAGAKEIRLKPGQYTVETIKNGEVVSRKLIGITRNGREVVRVSQEAPSPATKAEQNPDRRAAEYVLSIGGRIHINGEDGDRNLAELPREAFRLNWVSIDLNNQVTDAGLAHFKDCKYLTHLNLNSARVSDVGLAHFKECKLLTYLDLGSTQVSDAGLANFKNLTNLKKLNLDSTQVSDDGCAFFKDCDHLEQLVLRGTKVTDKGLAFFKNCKELTFIHLEGALLVTDTGMAHLKDFKKLTELRVHGTKVTAAAVEELNKALPQCKIVWNGGTIDPMAKLSPNESWERSVAAMAAKEQVRAIAARLKELNPDFDGVLEETIESESVTKVRFSAVNVSDLSPLRALTGLKELECVSISGKTGKLADLTPLRGLPLTHLTVPDCLIADLAPLKGMKLISLNCSVTKVSDLSPLAGMPLQKLSCGFTKVADLSPLRGMKLTEIDVQVTEVSDLAPLRGMPLRSIGCYYLRGVTDISPLAGMPLFEVNLHSTGVSDLSPLKGIPLVRLNIPDTPVTDLTPIKEIRTLEMVSLGDLSRFADLSPLKGLELQELRLLNYKEARDGPILRELTTLKVIDSKPAEQFWKQNPLPAKK